MVVLLCGLRTVYTSGGQFDLLNHRPRNRVRGTKDAEMVDIGSMRILLVGLIDATVEKYRLI
jgi:hypothetical protein